MPEENRGQNRLIVRLWIYPAKEPLLEASSKLSPPSRKLPGIIDMTLRAWGRKDKLPREKSADKKDKRRHEKFVAKR